MRILIIPELYEKRAQWDRVITILSKIGYEVDFLDYTLPQDDDLTNQATEAEYYLTDKTILVGSGIGGRIAVQLMARHHHQIIAAVLLATPSLIHKGIVNRMMSLGAFVLLPIRLFLSHGFKKRFRQRLLDYIYRSPKERLYQKIILSDQSTLLPIVRNEVKLVWGSSGRRVPLKTAAEMRAAFQKADLVVVKDGREPLHINHPTIVAGFIDEYARSN